MSRETAKVRIYTREVCPYCDQAKALFKQLQIEFEEIQIDDDPELFRKLSRENNGWRTVPMIFVGEKFLGGFTDVYDLHKKGGLLPLI